MIKLPLWVYVVAALALTSAIGYGGYRLEKHGYDRRVNEDAVAAAKLKDTARENIVQTDKKYDAVDVKIHQTPGPNLGCGVRTQHALDSMPAPGSD